MGIRNATASSGEKRQYELPKKGPRVGILIGIIDVGVQVNVYKGEAKRPRREFIPVYILPNDTYETEDGDEKNFILSQYPVPLQPGATKSNYYKWFPHLDPENKVLDKDGAGDITKLIGKACFINIKHTKPNADGIVYANIESISELPDDYPIKECEYDEIIFDLEEPSQQVFEKLTDFQRDCIRKSEDYAGSETEAILEGSGNVTEDDGGAEESNEAPETDSEDSPI